MPPVEAPVDVVTITSFAPAVPLGAEQVSVVVFTTFGVVQVLPPIVTEAEDVPS